MPKNSKDIFDLTDVSDLPEELRPKGPRSNHKAPTRDAYIEVLQKAGRPVSPQEIAAALFRSGYDGPLSFKTVGQQIAAFTKTGHVQKVGRAQYAAKPE